MSLWFILLLYVLGAQGQIADIDRLQHDLSKFLSMPRYNSSQKSWTRMSIRHALDGVGLQTISHTFIPDEGDELGVNLLSIQRGPHYDTSDDKVVVVSANYDTEENSPGVDDNGSGVAAVLETARAMATLDRLYQRNNTIIYAFFDMKHQFHVYLALRCLFFWLNRPQREHTHSPINISIFFHALVGSHAFVEEVLLPYLSRSNASVVGVLVLDGVLNFDAFPATQSVPEGFEEIFPTAARELHEHNHMGDFIQLIGRVKKDDVIVQHFLAAFARSTGMNAGDWSFRPWLLLLRLPVQGINSVEDMYRMHPYLFADHSSFFFHSNQNMDLPTIYISDTCEKLNRRGVRQYCPHCDSLYMLTDQNLRFLTIIVDTVIRTVIQLSDSGANMIVDELYFYQNANDIST
ncbi:hypothetical protein ANCCAN_23543 [Ancylostoma caninum]|uniref:Peptidase M28 domain-containing protein n=1 Tax=Ancylostoma caninum TaxID=29170 RepID=A0A368FI61_ANCCA|nr:hypothetical protein ANCCAN_23543 [Ancylostoma caninum]